MCGCVAEDTTGKVAVGVLPCGHTIWAYPTGIQQRNPDGSWSPAQPIGWQEEHGPVARLIFWVRGVEHCNDREGQRRARWRRG